MTITPKELAEVRSTAEQALTLIVQHEKVCAARYVSLEKITAKVYIGTGILLAMQVFVGFLIAVKFHG